MKIRVNISLGAKLHAAAKKFASARDMDFSELVSKVLRDELEHPSSKPIAELPGTPAPVKIPPTLFSSTAAPAPSRVPSLNEAPPARPVVPAAPRITKTRVILRKIAQKTPKP